MEAVPVEGWAFVPPELPPVLDWERVLGRLWDPLSRASAALARLEGIDATVPVLRPIWIREVQASSEIEGTVATIEEVALAATGHAFERDAPREVWNNLRALEHGISSPQGFSRGLLREMHAILFEGVAGETDRPGEFRQTPAYIGDPRRGFGQARFVPPPPERVEGLLADLERYVNREDRHTPALVRVALAHYQFEAIHPFADGNGRLGRLLVARSLCKEGLLSRPLVSISAYIGRRRAVYYGGLLRVSTHGTEGAWEEWLRFFLEAVADQARDVELRSARLRGLREDMVARVASRREPSDAMVRLIDALFEQPALSVPGAAERLGQPQTTVRRNVERLVEEGILTEATGGKYDRRYVAPAIIKVAEEEIG